LSFDKSSTNPTRTDRLNLNGYFYATKLYSGGTEVSVIGHTHNYAASSHTHGNITNDGKIGSAGAIRAVTLNTSNQIIASDLSVSDPSASGTSTSFIKTIS